MTALQLIGLLAVIFALFVAAVIIRDKIKSGEQRL
jgi:hypothetical protein